METLKLFIEQTLMNETKQEKEEDIQTDRQKEIRIDEKQKEIKRRKKGEGDQKESKDCGRKRWVKIAGKTEKDRKKIYLGEGEIVEENDQDLIRPREAQKEKKEEGREGQSK